MRADWVGEGKEGGKPRAGVRGLSRCASPIACFPSLPLLMRHYNTWPHGSGDMRAFLEQHTLTNCGDPLRLWRHRCLHLRRRAYKTFFNLPYICAPWLLMRLSSGSHVAPWSMTTRQSDLVFPLLLFVECQGVDQRYGDCGRRGATKLLVTCILIPKNQNAGQLD